MARLFFAIDLQSTDKHTLHQFVQGHLPELKQPTTKKNLHMTLAFLGQVTDTQQQALLDYATTVKPLHNQTNDLVLNHLGVFTKARVLYLGLSAIPCWLTKLANELSQQAKLHGLFQEERPYRPHLTIARKVTEPPSIDVPELRIKVSSFSLYRSESTYTGVTYTPVKTFLL